MSRGFFSVFLFNCFTLLMTKITGILRNKFILIFCSQIMSRKIKGDFKNNASISLINVYRLSKADLLLKLILRYVINVFLASCQVSSL